MVYISWTVVNHGMVNIRKQSLASSSARSSNRLQAPWTRNVAKNCWGNRSSSLQYLTPGGSMLRWSTKTWVIIAWLKAKIIKKLHMKRHHGQKPTLLGVSNKRPRFVQIFDSFSLKRAAKGSKKNDQPSLVFAASRGWPSTQPDHTK